MKWKQIQKFFNLGEYEKYIFFNRYTKSPM